MATPEADAPAPPAETLPIFKAEQLDQLLAPVALYPDALLAQILMAATYPLAQRRTIERMAVASSVKLDTSAGVTVKLKLKLKPESLSHPAPYRVVHLLTRPNRRLSDRLTGGGRRL
jgi:hypothetical protein